MTYCFGCGARIWTPKNENESGEFCSRSGECKIRNFEGVNRLREAFLEDLRARCVHAWVKHGDENFSYETCEGCHATKSR